MFTSVGTRSAQAYKSIGIETSVSGASSHHLVSLLFDTLQQQLLSAKSAMLAGDIPAKGRAIGRVVRILEEGLKASLDLSRGGELAGNLHDLYNYCIFKTTEANLRNSIAMVDEVIRLIAPVADAWKQIGGQLDANAQSAHKPEYGYVAAPH
ncbi:flagellar export chaperone FliS [Rhodoferax sp. U11-2br]|uniref:flagellar export chaperone FliS n=1 Tax=Rhodoferax sp. U11-2br TaxID=2838878 RepID=UPI001BE5F193|nr:flagellar export chaperone FliS [Rhodoferax sp. U11-2br]MBT3067584.1 flagellar export chaperone FliS [Rhodoferax sp. U11-2br]